MYFHQNRNLRLRLVTILFLLEIRISESPLEDVHLSVVGLKIFRVLFVRLLYCEDN